MINLTRSRNLQGWGKYDAISMQDTTRINKYIKPLLALRKKYWAAKRAAPRGRKR